MPILHHVRQGSDAWDKLRLGIPTSSVFDRVWTPPSVKYPRGQQSKQWEDLGFTLLAERFLGYKMATYVSPHMEDGKEYEEEAADWYELTTHRVPVLIGFITNDAGTIGCSPDRLVGDDGLLEVKVPKANTQMKYLIKGTIAVDYWPQLQGQLWISDRQWVDIVAYSQILPRCVIRVERDEPYIAKLAAELDKLVEYIEVCWEKIQEMAGRSNGAPKDPRQGDLGRLKAQLEASLAHEDKARSAGTVGAHEPVPEPDDSTTAHRVARGSRETAGEAEHSDSASPTKVWRCSCGEEFEIYGAFSRHRQRTGHKAPTEQTRARVPPDSTTEETFWDIAARSGDYKVEIPDKNIATIGRDTLMNLISGAPSLGAMVNLCKANQDAIQTMARARRASFDEFDKAMTRRKKELSGE